jgi:hypothetical protein
MERGSPIATLQNSPGGVDNEYWNSPVDSTIWLNYCWKQFVLEIFPAYTLLLQRFLERACAFDINADVAVFRDPRGGTGSAIPIWSEIGMLSTVLKVYASSTHKSSTVQYKNAPSTPESKYRDLARRNIHNGSLRRINTSPLKESMEPDLLRWMREGEQALVENALKRLAPANTHLHGLSAPGINIAPRLLDALTRLEGSTQVIYNPVLLEEDRLAPDSPVFILLLSLTRAADARSRVSETHVPVHPRRASISSPRVATDKREPIQPFPFSPTTTSIMAAQKDAELRCLDRAARLLREIFSIGLDDWLAAYRSITNFATLPEPSEKLLQHQNAKNREKANETKNSIGVYVNGMSNDGLSLSPQGRLQLASGFRKSPPIPRLKPGQLDRKIYYSTEIPALVDASYYLSDIANELVLKLITKGEALGENTFASSFIRRCGHSPLSFRFLADRSTFGWLLILLWIVFSGRFLYFPIVLLICGWVAYWPFDTES